MNLEEQNINGVNQVLINDSLNAGLLELKLKMSADTIKPDDNKLIIYVDKTSKESPSTERKVYLFELKDKLRYYNGIGDEFRQELNIVNNDIKLQNLIERKISYDETTFEESILETSSMEYVDSMPIILFEGINYIYTNYENIEINMVYTKDNLMNKTFINKSIYAQHNLTYNENGFEDNYYKNAFTKSGTDLNLEINNLKLENLSSSKDKFSLDENGNLIVDSITCNHFSCDDSNISSETGTLNKEGICNIIYPVGSIYISVNDISPENLFIGTWEKIKDKFLLASGDTFANGLTGGEISHILSQSELPSHSHLLNGNTNSSGAHMHRVVGTASTNGAHSHPIGADLDAQYTTTGTKSNSLHGKGTSGASKTINTGSSGDHTHAISGNTDNLGDHTHEISITSSSIGNSVAHNNMPPYLTVNIWKRIL